MVEENETPGDDSPAGSQPGGLGSEGRARRSEGDLLAERRARRAAESGEHVLTLRAEAAEATVRTLETHVSSLQQRLRDAEEESRRAAEMVAADRPVRSGGGGPQTTDYPGRRSGSEDVVERELRQVKQREYAEQRLRVEAEDQLIDLERDSRAEVDRLSRRLGESELEARKLAGRLESVQRELAEAEQAAGAERAATRRDEQILHVRVTELEHRALELQRSLEAERAARQRTERLLEVLRRGHRTVEALVAELKDIVARLKTVAATAPAGQPPPGPAPLPAPPAPQVAAAVGATLPAEAPTVPERATLPAEAPTVPERATLPAEAPTAPEGATVPAEATTAPDAPDGEQSFLAQGGLPHGENGEMVDALAAAVERLRARVAEQAELTAPPVAKPPKHKHSQSLIRRLRIARKQRRER